MPKHLIFEHKIEIMKLAVGNSSHLSTATDCEARYKSMVDLIVHYKGTPETDHPKFP